MIRAEASAEALKVEGGKLAELYALHVDAAFRLAYLLTGNRAQAEDLVQDAFVRLAGRLLHLRKPGGFEAYLRTTVVNLANSHFRHRKVEQRYLEREAGLRPADVNARDVGERERMREALMALPLRQRTAVVLRFYEDLSETQAAELMRCRPGTVRSLASRGIEALRSRMGGAVDG